MTNTQEQFVRESKDTYNELFYKVSRLSRLVEDLNIDETKIKKEDIVPLDTMPTDDNTEFDTIYSYEDKLYKKISGEFKDEVVCYTDVFLELLDANNQIALLSKELSKIEDEEEKKEEK